VQAGHRQLQSSSASQQGTSIQTFQECFHGLQEHSLLWVRSDRGKTDFTLLLCFHGLKGREQQLGHPKDESSPGVYEAKCLVLKFLEYRRYSAVIGSVLAVFSISDRRFGGFGG
jgi:hypothetical protein